VEVKALRALIAAADSWLYWLFASEEALEAYAMLATETSNNWAEA
jgi:hypothetical protein